MSKSLLQKDDRCYLCGRRFGLERHHILAGPNRHLSEKYGLWVLLCHNCHVGNEGAQYDKDKNRQLKEEAQEAFEKEHGHGLWMQVFRINYL